MKFLILLCMIVVAFAANKNIHAETENFVVDVTGNQNVPKYTFYTKSHPKDTYSIFFDQFYECTGNPCSKDGPSNIALPSLSWTFSDITETDSQLTFTMTSGSINNRLGSLVFVNHLFKEGNDTVPLTGMKFDIHVNEYRWVSSNSQAKLVLAFRLDGKGGRAYFDSTNTADADSGEISVDLANQSKTYFLTYDHFQGSFVHDPTFGINGAPQIVASAFLITLLISIVSLF